MIQEFVEKRNVIAFVYNAAPLSGQVSLDYIKAKQIPVIGSEAAGDWFYQSPFFFPQSTSGRYAPAAALVAASVSALPAGEKKLGIIVCSDGLQTCEQTASLGPGFARQVGFEPVYSGRASLAQPDFTANCLAARDQGAQLLLISLDGNSAQRLLRSCASIGYHPKLILNQQISFDFLAADDNLQGSYTTGLNAAWVDRRNPAVAEFQRAMAQYAPGVSLAGTPMQGWAAARLFGVAARNLPEPPTSASILDGLYGLKGETLDGLAAPLTFTRGQNAPVYVCAWPMAIRDHAYQVVGDGTVQCRDVR
ncbi:MAG: ABC transporter substrate-binding protein [Actinobacteria bacterium]|nr:ABC transporter substrate-binding protein [Actinomycetota bacterium]